MEQKVKTLLEEIHTKLDNIETILEPEKVTAEDIFEEVRGFYNIFHNWNKPSRRTEQLEKIMLMINDYYSLAGKVNEDE